MMRPAMLLSYGRGLIQKNEVRVLQHGDRQSQAHPRFLNGYLDNSA